MCNPNGYLKISRRIFTHWIAENPEWLKWWLWILANANWADAKKTPRDTAPLKRGQLRISQRYLQSEWARLKNGKVQSTPDTRTIWKFLETLQDDGMIKLEKRHHAETLVTVCNYDLYQDDTSTTSSTTSSTKHKKVKNINNSSSSSSGERVCAHEEGFADFVAEMKGDQVWLERMTARYGLRPPDIEKYLSEFADDCACRGNEDDTYGDTMRHFNNWLCVKLEKQQQQNATTSTSRRADEEDAAKQHRYAIYGATLQRLLGS